MDLKLVDLAILVSKLALGSHLPPPLQCWGYKWVVMPTLIYLGARVSNSNPHICTTSILDTEPSPWVPFLFL